LQKASKAILFILLISALSGTSSSLFLYALKAATQLREGHLYLIGLLPLFAVVQLHFNVDWASRWNLSVPDVLKNSSIGHRVHEALSALYILISSVGTHLFGGSAGREGVGLIMSASLIDRFSEYFSSLLHRSVIIKCAIAAGFSSMFGTPIAGAIFAVELLGFGYKEFLFCLASSFGSTYVTHLLHAPHTTYIVQNPVWNVSLIIPLLMIALVSGLGARLFYYGLALMSLTAQKVLKNRYLLAFLSTLLVIAIAYFGNQFHLLGIGVSHIQLTMSEAVPVSDGLLKILLTVLTIGVGLKGGEVTPLFFIGACLSNALGAHFGFQPLSVWSALGFVSVFSAATSTPIASSFVALELFGPQYLPLALVTCFLSKLLMYKKTIYRTH